MASSFDVYFGFGFHITPRESDYPVEDKIEAAGCIDLDEFLRKNGFDVGIIATGDEFERVFTGFDDDSLGDAILWRGAFVKRCQVFREKYGYGVCPIDTTKLDVPSDVIDKLYKMQEILGISKREPQWMICFNYL